ncbi:MAG: hypothetical protein KDB65_10530 [Calditrichaeota bacterium]|nr:hypothetical protein [Calditrichota bacterium]
MPAALLTMLIVFSSTQVSTAALEDIKPRPQQMGSLAVTPVVVDGALTLVMPDNPNVVEAYVRDEAIAQFTAKMGIPLTVVPYSQWQGQGYALWLGTPQRFPALVDSLLDSQIPGMGVLTHEEEYQLLVGANNTFLAGYDHLGMEWGLFSLLELMGEVFGQTTIDRAYVRDWPDFPKRVCTVNSSVRIQSQYDYCDSLFNWAYACKMDEIEWNDPDGGHAVRSDFALSHALLLRAKLARRGQFLTFGTDQTALRVLEKCWQEGIPIIDMPMTVGTTQFSPVSYGITVNNGGFETFTGNIPNGWTMYPTAGYSLLSRDVSYKHSGSSSLRWYNMSSGYELDRTVHQRMHFGANRLMRLHFWYKTSSFHGRLRLLVLGDEPINNHFINNRIGIPTTTDWTEGTFVFSTYNLDTASIWIGPEEYSSGSLWIDDVTIENVGPMNMLRRDDTPVEVYKEPGHILMTEGADYTIVETGATNYDRYITGPRISRVSGGALAVGNQVSLDWYSAIQYQGARETVCWSMLEPLEYYQDQIRNLDSTLAPNGIKIHINEVSMAGYDQGCTSRGLSPGQLVGSYVDQMYDIVQARRPGMFVRSYGDAFDIWVKDNRAHPITTSPWTIGSLPELSPYVEIMMMTDYSTNFDSSFAYMNAQGHNAIMSYYGASSIRLALEGAEAAHRASNCVGFEMYDWALGNYIGLPEFASMGWNLGPYFIHEPVRYTVRPDTVFLTAEMWSDSFAIPDPIYITSKLLTFRFSPGGTWTTIVPTASGPRFYTSQLITPQNATSLEYYYTATDNRDQTRRLPPEAPTRVFSAVLPAASSSDDARVRIDAHVIVPTIDGQLITWPPVADADSYQIHKAVPGDLSRREQTLVATVPGDQTQFYLDPELFGKLSADELIVLPLVNSAASKLVIPKN